VSKTVRLLIVGTLLLWGLVAYPARLLWGESALLFSATAAALCLVPTVVSLAWASGDFTRDPQQRVLVIFCGMGLRMVFVIGVGMMLYQTVPEFFFQRF